jgi:hypothetical protein
MCLSMHKQNVCMEASYEDYGDPITRRLEGKQ